MLNCAHEHPNEKVPFMWEMPCDTAPGVQYRNRTFNIMGGDIKKYAENITFNPVSGKLIIPTKSTVTESPVRKISRINTPIVRYFPSQWYLRTM